MNQPYQLKSELDASVNFVQPHEDGGYFESRYVTRGGDYFVVYLSSQTGCKHGCRMCHLTATNQKMDTNATVEDYIAQAARVFNWYDEHGDRENIKQVHFNWMSRGEVFANDAMFTQNQKIFSALDAMAKARFLTSRFLLSTIMPKRLGRTDLAFMLRPIQPEIYYSIYSLDPEFRKKWLPAAMDPIQALEMLAGYQRNSRKLLKLHWAFIKDENDSEASVQAICDAVKKIGLRVDINIVRYNPASSSYGEESWEDVIEDRVAQLKAELPDAKIKVIPRVGFDVAASCGMFVTG